MMLYLLLAIPIALFPISLTILLWKAPPLKGRLQSLRVVYDKLSEEERKHVPYPEDYYPGGAYVQLEHGETHYHLLGPENGLKVVLIHGLSWPSPVWDGIARGLVDQGMRVLLYDLYGRGYTQAPDVPHTMSFYVEQLSQLLEHIGWEKTIVIGLSMGGAIATGFTAKYPEKVQRLGLVAPAGLMSEAHVSKMLKLIHNPWMMRLAMGALSLLPYSFLARRLKKRVPKDLENAALLNAWHVTHHPGVLRSVAFSLRDLLSTRCVKDFLAVGQQTDLPVTVIWGPADTIVPFECFIHLRQAIPHARLVVIDDAGHDLVVTHTKPVLEAITSMITDQKH